MVDVKHAPCVRVCVRACICRSRHVGHLFLWQSSFLVVVGAHAIASSRVFHNSHSLLCSQSIGRSISTMSCPTTIKAPVQRQLGRTVPVDQNTATTSRLCLNGSFFHGPILLLLLLLRLLAVAAASKDQQYVPRETKYLNVWWWCRCRYYRWRGDKSCVHVANSGGFWLSRTNRPVVAARSGPARSFAAWFSDMTIRILIFSR
jgi:hypothetical protein